MKIKKLRIYKRPIGLLGRSNRGSFAMENQDTYIVSGESRLGKYRIKRPSKEIAELVASRHRAEGNKNVKIRKRRSNKVHSA